MKIFRLGHDSLKEQYGTFYEKKFERKKKYKLITIVIFSMIAFLFGYYFGLGL